MKIYAQPTGDLTAFLTKLAQHIETVNDILAVIPDEVLEQHAPGKWSRKEMLGHLIDSALHNLRRFTEAQFATTPYAILPYNPDELVRINGYNSLKISDLLLLWTNLNRQIGRVVLRLHEERPALYDAPIVFASGETNTLGWLIEDYLAHMEHHLQKLI